jgi:nicotinamide mononucleotide transporter
LAWFFNSYTDAERPYIDSFTTVFSFLATFLEAKKVLSSWKYWIVINGVTIGLYFDKGLDIYAGLILVYFIMSFVGYFKWKKLMA